jgi:hypothetical protein
VILVLTTCAVTTKEAMERERILRQDWIDYAQTTRSSYSSPGMRGRVNTVHVGSSIDAIESAREHTAQLMKLYESSQSLRIIIRSMDAFLVALMDGRVARGQEAFVHTLRDIVAQFYSIPRELDLYLALTYGDTRKSCTVSYAFAKQYGLFGNEVQAIEQEVDDKKRQIRQGKISLIEAEFAERSKLPAICHEHWQDYQSQLTLDLVKKLEITNRFGTHQKVFNDLPDMYIILNEYPAIKTLLSPYFNAHFKPPWHKIFAPVQQSIEGLLRDLDYSFEDCKFAREYVKERRKMWRKQPELHTLPYAWRIHSLPYTFFLLNDDMKLNRNWQFLI